jgi:anti-sigma B factor antagonist
MANARVASNGSRLDVEVAYGGDDVRVSISGEVDMVTCDRLAAALEAAEHEATGLLVLDLGELAFIDSTGLRAILLCAQRARRSSRRIVAINTPPGVSRLFQLTAIDRSIEVRPAPH